MSPSPRPDQAVRPRRRKRGLAGREPVTQAALKAGSYAYIETKMAYHIAFSKLWAFPPAEGSIAAHTAVVLGKLLEYQEAFKDMASRDSLYLLEMLVDPEDRRSVELLHGSLLAKLDQLSVLEQEFRADRVVYSAYVLASLQRSGVNG